MNDSSRTGAEALRVGRRRFLGLGLLGGAATLLALPAGTSRADENKAEALVLSCMDYRLIHDTERYMAGRGLEKKFYHVTLTGAALAAVTPKRKAWNTTFWDHLETALKLQPKLGKVFVIDHRDCGAYDLLLKNCCRDREGKIDPAKETVAHTAQLRALRKEIGKRYPKMQVELLLMDLNGQVEPIA